MPAPVRKTTAKAAKRAAPVAPPAAQDDFTAWQDRQPAIAVFKGPGDEEETFTPGDVPSDKRTEERAPNIPSPFATRVRSALNNAKTSVKPAKATRAKAPKPRVSVESLISGAWQLLAQVTSPINVPVARVIDMQAPVAGMILEDTIKNTVVDRVLQPLARIGSGGEVAFSLIGPPLFVGILTRNPGAAPVVVPLLRQSLMSWIKIAGPKLEEVERKEREFQEQYGSRIDEMIAYFISEIPQQPEKTPDAANPNGRPVH